MYCSRGLLKCLGFSCNYHSDWLVQTVVEAADAEDHETKGLGTDVSVLVPMVPDAKESDADL
jgi:hypothetical protein